jgi:nucleotide-binding universal stress UspA family protein
MEKAFSKILIAFDNSDAAMAALQSAYGVSLKLGSKITAVVVSGNDADTEASKKVIGDFAAERKIDIAIEERSGSVPDVMDKMEKEGDFELILIGSHGTSGWKKFLVGSNAFKVVTHSTCPVITVTAKASSPELNNILLPISDSRNTRQKIPYCIEMAKAFGATVHILGASKSTNDETKRKVNSYVHQAEQFLTEKGVKCTTKTEFGEKVAETCIAYGEAMNVGLMVIMAETESSGIFMDSYSEQLVNKSTVPVMCIHAKDTRLAGAAGY